MNLIALKFIVAGVIVVAVGCLALAIGAAWIFCTRIPPKKSAPGGSRQHPDRKNHDHQCKRSLDRG
jgi:hypothetical protein